MFGDEVFVGEVAGYRRGFSLIGCGRVVSFDHGLSHTRPVPRGAICGLSHLKPHPTSGIESAKRSRGAEIPHLARNAAEDIDDRFTPSVLSGGRMVGSTPAVAFTRQRGRDVWEVAVLLRGSSAAFTVPSSLVWIARVRVCVLVLFKHRGSGRGRGIETAGKDVAGVYEGCWTRD